MPRTKTTRGFALLELLMALGIGVLMMAAVWAVFGQREQDLRVQKAFDAIEQLVTVADTGYASSEGYWVTTASGVQAITLQRLHALIVELPDSIIHQGGTTYTNPWGGNWTVGSASTASGNRDLMVITLTDLPVQSCITLVSRMAPRMFDTRVNSSLVGLTPARTQNAAGRDRVRTDQLIGLCEDGDNTVAFRRLKPVDYTMLRSQPMNPNTLSAWDTTHYLPAFQRIEQAMTAREAAQVAIP